MGMDIIGKRPASEQGASFRRNIWRWYPLAHLIVELCWHEARSCADWFTNDGYGLNARKSLRLAGRLDALIGDGTIKSYCENRDASIARQPETTCRCCGGRGHNPMTGDVCNGCNGRKLYIFDQVFATLTEADVAAFAAFLKDCGGFSIY